MPRENERLLMLVVGAHLDAERDDRELARELSAAAVALQQQLDVDSPYEMLTCTDVWYLNDASLLIHPVVSIGRPETNAATAFLAGRIPTALIVDHMYRIHFDPCGVHQQACIWGTSPTATGTAVEAFRQRHLEPFLRLAHDLPVNVA